MMDVIILAGGLGTRLREVVSDVPKPMAEVNGKPFLDFLINQLHDFPKSAIILSVGHQAEKIKAYYRDKNFIFCQEETPLGTGGAVKKALDLTKTEDVLVMNGDSFFDLDLNAFCSFHKKQHADLTIACREVEDISRYGSITFDRDLRIKGFYEKEVSRNPGWINGGIYLMKKEVLDSFAHPCFSLEKEAFPNLLEKRVFAYRSEGQFIDIGTKESYFEAQHLLKSVGGKSR